jgi:peroxiredoxin
MARVELNAPAPEFTLTDYQGTDVSLSQFKGKQRVLLVFNRGFN